MNAKVEAAIEKIRKQFELSVDRKHFPLTKNRERNYICKRTQRMWEGYIKRELNEEI